MFKVEIIGNIGADAEVKNVQGSKFVAFRVAHTNKFKNQQGQETEETTWIDVTMNDTESKVIPFLKAGVKVFVRGNAALRVYSSPKLRQMVAGLRVSAWEVELCGGTSDLVPRQLINPSDGSIHDVQKYYWINHNTEGMKPDEYVELIDKGGRLYMMNNQGFVAPMPQQDDDQQDENQANAQTDTKVNANQPTKEADKVQTGQGGKRGSGKNK